MNYLKKFNENWNTGDNTINTTVNENLHSKIISLLLRLSQAYSYIKHFFKGEFSDIKKDWANRKKYSALIRVASFFVRERKNFEGDLTNLVIDREYDGDFKLYLQELYGDDKDMHEDLKASLELLNDIDYEKMKPKTRVQIKQVRAVLNELVEIFESN